MKNILVADEPAMDGRYAAALAGWDIAFARTLPQARQALAARRCALVAIGAYFDDSQMFDLLRAIRGDDTRAGTPILCVRARPGFTAVTSRTLEASVKALGADEFLDLVHFDDDRAAEAALRAAAERLLKG